MVKRIPLARRGWLLIVALMVWFAVPMSVAASPSTEETPGPDGFELVLFWGDGCPHCAAEHEWLATVEDEYPDLEITTYEVWKHPENLAVMEEWAERFDFEPGAVPTTIIGGRVWVGFSGPIRTQMESALIQLRAGDPVTGGSDNAVISLPLFGEVSLEDSSLIVSTLLIGFVDGINPCSLWVISMLLAIVVRTGSRRRVLVVGTSFLVVTSLMYAFYMAGIYSALAVVGHLGSIQVAVAVLAGVFGLVSVKDYFAFKRGISFTIPDTAKPSLYRRMRSAAGADHLPAALLATVGLAVGVSLLETPCTAGFPVIWTGLLAAHDVAAAQAVGLFALYMVPFLIDELVVFGVVVFTMRATKLQEKHGRVLKLVAGTTMLALAGTVLVRPETMNNPLQALLVFAGAFAIAWMVHHATQRRLERAEEASTSDSAPPRR